MKTNIVETKFENYRWRFPYIVAPLYYTQDSSCFKLIDESDEVGGGGLSDALFGKQKTSTSARGRRQHHLGRAIEGTKGEINMG